MFRNYLISAYRNILKNRLTVAINVLGLSIGLAACILALHFVRDELSYDRFFAEGERIYRIDGILNFPDRAPNKGSSTPAVLHDKLLSDFPQMERVTRAKLQELPIVDGDRRFMDDVLTVDANFLEMFDFDFVQGDPRTALSDTSSLIVTEATAQKLFGNEPPLGRVVTVDFDKEMRVTAVIRNLPRRTHFRFGSMRVLNPADFEGSMTNWGSFRFLTYIALRRGSSIESVIAGLPSLLNRYVPERLTSSLDMKASEFFEFVPIPLKDLHLKGFGSGGMARQGSIIAIYAFSAIAIMVLIVAAINFINLSTARATLRAREVAIRKVSGAKRSQLITQFLVESIFVAFLALAVAMAMVELALPWYNDLFLQLLSVDWVGNPGMTAAAIGLVVVVGLGGGIHPAFVQSAFRPAEILKSGSSATQGRTGRSRTILVITQFTISIVLIIATSVIYAQMRFAQTLDLGFDTDSVLVLRNVDDTHIMPAVKPLMRALEAHPDVLSVTRSMSVPGDDDVEINRIIIPGHATDDPPRVRYQYADFDFLRSYGVQPLAGRLFDSTLLTDAALAEGAEEPSKSAAAVVNLSLARKFGAGSPEDAIGKTFRQQTPNSPEYTIIGVIPDLYFDTLKNEIEPTYYIVAFRSLRAISVRYQTEDLEDFLSDVDALWLKYVAGEPIEREFLSDNLDSLYQTEEISATILAMFSIIAILVSCLGLFGLSAFAVERRTREIGIRKVFGASSGNIITLMAWQFTRPVLLANLIAWPIAGYATSQWLQGFAYRIDLTPAPFLIASGTALLIAWATVAGQAWRVARTNPIHALRYE